MNSYSARARHLTLVHERMLLDTLRGAFEEARDAERKRMDEVLGVVAFVHWAQRQTSWDDWVGFERGHLVGYHRGETNAAEDAYAVLGLVAFVQWARRKSAGRYTDYDKGWDAGLAYVLDKRRGHDVALGIVALVSWARENGQPAPCWCGARHD